MKKYSSVLIVFLAIYIPGSAFADPGICGDNLTWKLTEDGTLTISSTGEMYDYASGDKSPHIPWYEISDNIKNIVISDGITKIGKYAFEKCTNVVSVTLPDSVTQLSDSAFHSCTSLQIISLPDNIETLPVSVFGCCSSLKKIKFPKNLKKIEDNAFHCCGIEELELPESVNEIGEYAFKWSKIKRIQLPDNITNISYYTFDTSEDLQIVRFPKNLKTIEETAFNNCVSIREIYLPDSLERIDRFAFLQCTNLEKIYIPKSVTYIGDLAFFAGYADVQTSHPLIYGYAGSIAEKYAKENQFEFVPVTKSMYDPDADFYNMPLIERPVIVVTNNSGNIKNISIGSSRVDFCDAFPFADNNGSIQIPVRAVAEAIGATVTWNGENQSVTIEKDDIKLEIFIGNSFAGIFKNNSKDTMYMNTFIKDDRTFIPLDAFAEAFDCDVSKSDNYEVVWGMQ